MPEHFDSFFDSGCPIPVTFAPLALHCLLNQFKMTSFELTFKAVQYSVYYFSFSFLSLILSCWSLSLLGYLSWLLVLDHLLWLCVDSQVIVTSCMLLALLQNGPAPSLGYVVNFYTPFKAPMAPFQEPILSKSFSNNKVNLSLLGIVLYMHLLLNDN